LATDPDYNDPDVFIIERGNSGFGHDATTPLPWNAGDIFANLITAGTLDNFVQAGTGPADTSIVYVGTDTSTDPAHIIAVTNPVPANYAVGMLFNIKVGGSWPAGIAFNSGTVDMQLNGVPAIFVKHTDGSDMTRGDFTKNMEYIFVYNGVTFSTTIMNVPHSPPQLTFYIRADSTSIVDSNGLESNTGFANTPQDAFKTIQGAANTIAYRYISTQRIKLMVSDGTYTTGLYHASPYIASWELQGNDANPQNCVIDCRSQSSSSYVPGAAKGVCILAGSAGNIVAHGFTLESWGQNVASASGRVEVYGMNFTSPVSGHTSCISVVQGGSGLVWGTCSYTSTTGGQYIFEASYSGTLSLGALSDYPEDTRALNWIYNGTISGVGAILASTSAVVDVCNAPGNITVSGSKIAAREYIAQYGAGVGFTNPVGAGLFATVPGQTTSPGWNING
jgi:hypothetical protein